MQVESRRDLFMILVTLTFLTFAATLPICLRTSPGEHFSGRKADRVRVLDTQWNGFAILAPVIKDKTRKYLHTKVQK